jgi:putative tricarboxylic transport membrane protein
MSRQTERSAGGPTRRKDWVGAVGSAFFAFLGVYVFVTSFAMSPMAAMFPRTIGAAMAVLAVLQIAASLTGLSGEAVERGSSLADQAESLGRRLALLATMIAWALLFPVIGIFVTSLAACLILMIAGRFGRQTPLQLAIWLAAVLVMVVVFYLLMASVLNIPMPRGLLF